MRLRTSIILVAIAAIAMGQSYPRKYLLSKAAANAPAVISDYDSAPHPMDSARVRAIVRDTATVLRSRIADTSASLRTAIAGKTDTVRVRAIVRDTATVLRSRLADTSSTLRGLIAAREPSISAGTTAQYWRGDKSWQTFPTTWAWGSITGKPTTRDGYGITDAQPLDADLIAIAALSTQSFGRSLLTQADAPTARATLGAISADDLRTGISGTIHVSENGGSGVGKWMKLGTVTMPNGYNYVTGIVEIAHGYSGAGAIRAHWRVSSATTTGISIAAVRLIGNSGVDPALLKLIVTQTWSVDGANTVELWYLSPAANASTIIRHGGIGRGDPSATWTPELSPTWVASPSAGTQYDGQYAILGNSARILGQSGTGNRLVQAGADGTQSASIPVPSAFAQTLLDDADQAAARATLGAGTGNGTVSSVALSAPANMTVSGSPVTSSGTLGLAWNGSSSNLVRADGSTVASSSFSSTSGLSGTGNRPVYANAAGVIGDTTAAAMREIIGATSSFSGGGAASLNLSDTTWTSVGSFTLKPGMFPDSGRAFYSCKANFGFFFYDGGSPITDTILVRYKLGSTVISRKSIVIGSSNNYSNVIASSFSLGSNTPNGVILGLLETKSSTVYGTGNSIEWIGSGTTSISSNLALSVEVRRGSALLSKMILGLMTFESHLD